MQKITGINLNALTGKKKIAILVSSIPVVIYDGREAVVGNATRTIINDGREVVVGNAILTTLNDNTVAEFNIESAYPFDEYVIKLGGKETPAFDAQGGPDEPLVNGIFHLTFIELIK